jgi:uncharacterized protein (TIGR02145 family)
MRTKFNHAHAKSILKIFAILGILVQAIFILNSCSSFLGFDMCDRKKGECPEKPDCNGKEYNTQKQFCYDSKLFNLCGDNKYNPETQSCKSGTVFGICGDKKYEVGVQDCCGGSMVYDRKTQVCRENTVFGKCAGMEYNTQIQFCSGNTIFGLCGGKEYDPATQFCSENSVYDKCDGKGYVPTIQRCENDIIEIRCGMSWYVPSPSYFCVDGTLTTSKGAFTDSRNSKEYEYITIGTQTWMAENLNYDVDGSKCGSTLSGKGTVGDANTPTCDTYGRLYDWATAMALPSSCNSTYCLGQVSAKHRGICPPGWHIPDKNDWDILMGSYDRNYSGEDRDTLIGSSSGTQLKATSGWDGDMVTGGEDTYGFSALSSGYGNPDGSFTSVGRNGYWWSANEVMSIAAYVRYMGNYNERAFYGNYMKGGWLSVRCLQD